MVNVVLQEEAKSLPSSIFDCDFSDATTHATTEYVVKINDS